MIIAGIALALIAYLAALPAWVMWLGIILIVVGACLNVVPLGGRRRRVY